MGYSMAYVLCHAPGVLNLTFALAGNAQTTTVFEAKFGWNEQETVLYNTIISSSAIVGLAIGSFVAGPLIKTGRRKGAIIANLMGIVSSAIAMAGTTPFLTAGRLLLGIAAGIYNVIFGKMIIENMPEHLCHKLCMFHNVTVCCGFVLAFGMGGLLPDAKDLEANKADEYWRVIYLVPAFIGIFIVLIVALVFKQEPIAYCIVMGHEEQGKQHMHRVYSKTDPKSSETIEEILESQYNFMRRSTTMDATSTTFIQAICGRKYRRASWTCFILSCFYQQTGVNAVILYANRLLVRMEAEGTGSFPLTPT